jgi:hypothetical protein
MRRQKARETAIAEATSGNSSTIIVASGLCEVPYNDQLSNTDPNVADVATMLSTVAVTDDRIGDRDCAGCSFLFFAFRFFVSIADPVGSGPLRRDPDAPRRFCFSDRWKDDATSRQRSA